MWSDRELLEAYAEVVRTVLTNYFNHLVGTELAPTAGPQPVTTAAAATADRRSRNRHPWVVTPRG